MGRISTGLKQHYTKFEWAAASADQVGQMGTARCTGLLPVHPLDAPLLLVVGKRI